MTISEQALGTKVWESLGSIASGGTVFGLAISPVEGVPRYWAATGCGIFMSDDGGQSWTQTLDGLTTPLLSALHVAPNGALFAGALGGDLFASFNYGKIWESGLVPEELKATVTVVMASPNFRKDGAAYAATDGGGLLVTRNSGKSWEDSGFGLGDPCVLALAATPDWSRQETMFAATTEGVFISRNGGRAWRETELMMDDDIVDVLAVSPSYEEDQTVYAGTEAGSLYRSTDGGRTWDLLQKSVGEGPVNCLWLAPNFAESQRLVAGVGSQIHVSTDGGESWEAVVNMPGSILSLTGNAEVVLAGLHDAGILKSVDGGSTWAPLESFASRGFSQLTAVDRKLYAMGPQEGLWLSEDEGRSWQPLASVYRYVPVSTVSIPSASHLFMANAEEGLLRSADGGESWEFVCQEAGIQAVLVLPDGSRGWAGTSEGKLLSSSDGGRTWGYVTSPCEGQEVLSIVASPAYAQDHTLYMGTAIAPTGNQQARVALWRSTNGGETWRQLTTQVTTARWVAIEMPEGADGDVASQAVVATGPFCLRPLRRAKDVWISTRVDPKGANALSVAVVGEIDEGGQLFAATGNGVFRSIDGGRTWHPFSEGISTQSCVSIRAVPSGDGQALYALSLGGTVWKCAL
ncbi:MAG: hypothetical protein FJZ90_09035 [Chloroflexi bacterium]|nr:hypothetical protein [Chloroflexota bacterium]